MRGFQGIRRVRAVMLKWLRLSDIPAASGGFIGSLLRSASRRRAFERGVRGKEPFHGTTLRDGRRPRRCERRAHLRARDASRPSGRQVHGISHRRRTRYAPFGRHAAGRARGRHRVRRRRRPDRGHRADARRRPARARDARGGRHRHLRIAQSARIQRYQVLRCTGLQAA